MPAPCGSCGATVMPYRRYMLQWSPTASCQHCGQRVRQRYFGLMVASAIALLGAFVAGIVLLESALAQGGFAGALAAVAFVLDYWTWRGFPWDPVPLARDAAPSQAPGT